MIAVTFGTNCAAARCAYVARLRSVGEEQRQAGVRCFFSPQRAGVTIILCSGRTEDEGRATSEWLATHGVTFGRFYMRPRDDFRADDLVKRIFLHKIRRHYPGHDIQFAIDDRQRVVDMWRSEGIVCLQGAPGFACNARPGLPAMRARRLLTAPTRGRHMAGFTI